MADEGFGEMLAELRTRPGMWRLMGTVEDEATAYLFTIACSTSAADHTQSDESFEFTYRAIESGKFQMFGRHVADPT